MRGIGRLAIPLGLGFAFLYLPILLMVIFSFNDSRMVTTFTGFSLRWYDSLWRNEVLMGALGLSLRIAAISATMATILGVLAGFALARFGRFRGRALADSAARLPDSVRTQMPEADWAGWETLRPTLHGPAGPALDDTLWFASTSLAPALLLWLRVYRQSHAEWFRMAA